MSSLVVQGAVHKYAKALHPEIKDIFYFLCLAVLHFNLPKIASIKSRRVLNSKIFSFFGAVQSPSFALNIFKEIDDEKQYVSLEYTKSETLSVTGVFLRGQH